MTTVAEQSLRKLLNELALEKKYNTDDIKIKPINSGGANYTTQLFLATLSSPGKEDIEVFAKFANVGEKMRAHSPVERFYQIEIYFYTELTKVYDKLQNNKEVAKENRIIIPKYYGGNTNRLQETIVLENLISKGYRLYDRMKSVDWEYASKAIEELAKFHALSFAYEEDNPEEFRKILSNLKNDRFDIATYNDQRKQFFAAMCKSGLDVVKEEHKERITKFIKDKMNITCMHKYNQPLRHPVLVHGDYRQSNLMHKRNSDGKLEIAIIDFQTLQAGCPILDLFYFIFNCSDEEFRAQYYEKLVEHYYTQLRLALQRLHIDPDKVYPRDDFDYELKEMLPYGLVIGLFILQIVTVEVANAPKLDDISEISVKTSDLYYERLNGIVNDYIKWGVV